MLSVVDVFGYANAAAAEDHAFNACPVFFLQPFTADQEREIRKLVYGIGQYEEGEVSLIDSDIDHKC
jgi:hypothetical protein